MRDFQGAIEAIVAARRILVLGSSGSGKTTFALQLGRLLNRPVVHLDAHFWQTGWRSTPPAEWREKVSELVRQPEWVMDGTYERSLDLRLPRAEMVLQIEESRWTCLWRIFKRKWTVDDDRRPDAPAGQKLDRAFVKYVWQYPAVTQPFVDRCLAQHGAGTPFVTLEGSRETRRFLQQLEPFRVQVPAV